MALRMKSWYCLVLLVTSSALAAKLPWPVSTSYASLDPDASAEWCVKYLGAEKIKPNITMSCNASSAWIRFPGSGYEIHFLQTEALANKTYSFADYVQYVDSLYGNLSQQTASSYDQFMDFHQGFITDDMTPFYQALTADHIPFFMVGQYPSFFDLFVEIPKTGAIFELTSQRLDTPNATLTPWDICVRNDTATSTTEVLLEKKEMNTTFPIVNWRKSTLAAPHPILAQLFAIDILGAQHIQQGHLGVWVERCAKISWVSFDYDSTPAGIPYEFHFVDGYKYPPYNGMDIVAFSTLQQDQRDYSNNQYDEWSSNRVQLWVEDLSPYYQRLTDRADIDVLLRRDNNHDQKPIFTIIMDTTAFAGNVIALVSDTFSSFTDTNSTDSIPIWDFCPSVVTSPSSSLLSSSLSS